MLVNYKNVVFCRLLFIEIFSSELNMVRCKPDLVETNTLLDKPIRVLQLQTHLSNLTGNG